MTVVCLRLKKQWKFRKEDSEPRKSCNLFKKFKDVNRVADQSLGNLAALSSTRFKEVCIRLRFVWKENKTKRRLEVWKKL